MAQINRHIFIKYRLYTHLQYIVCTLNYKMNSKHVQYYKIWQSNKYSQCTSYSCSGHGQNVKMIENSKNFLLSCHGFPILEIYYIIIITCLLSHGNANFIYSCKGERLKTKQFNGFK